MVAEHFPSNPFVVFFYKIVQIRKDVVKKVLFGSPIFQTFLETPSNLKKDEKICIFSEDKFIGCYNVINSGDLFAKPEFVKN